MTTTIGQAVTRATGHLGRLHLRATLRRQLAVVLGAVAAGAAVRPFVWPLHAQPSWYAVLRTAILAGGAGLVAVTVLVLRAWRSRPTPLASARRVDAALALEEVVASGYAFERDARDGEIVTLARQRALAALHGVDVRRLLRPARIERTLLGRNMVRLAVAGLFAALIFGGVDRLVVARFLRPVTSDERAAAAELRKAADALEKDADKTDKQDPKLVAAEAARKAAAATERGDRQAAMDALDEMRKAERAAEASEREQARELRALKDALDGKGASDGAGDRSASAADALAKLGKKDPAEVKKLAERLAKAEAAAKAAAKAASESGKGAASSSSSRSTASAWERAASALAEARAAAERGDPAAAKAAMERAAKEIEALEKSHGSASMQSLAKASASASSLDRSLQAGATAPKGQAAGNAMAGDGKDGQGKHGASGAKPGSKPGDGDGERGPGGGGGPGDRSPGQVAPERPKVEGDLQARADVREGEKAAGVIDGMGKGGDPKDYRAIFPAYDTAVEDGLREELVPAARRPAVRRYFESIRPNDPGDKP